MPDKEPRLPKNAEAEAEDEGSDPIIRDDEATAEVPDEEEGS